MVTHRKKESSAPAKFGKSGNAESAYLPCAAAHFFFCSGAEPAALLPMRDSLPASKFEMFLP